jgi:hypothetical protein
MYTSQPTGTSCEHARDERYPEERAEYKRLDLGDMAPVVSEQYKKGEQYDSLRRIVRYFEDVLHDPGGRRDTCVIGS